MFCLWLVTNGGGQFLCSTWTTSVHVAGASLQVPVYLSLGCAALDLPVPQGLLATGEVTSGGRVSRVKHIEQKITLAGDQGLLIPEDNWQVLEPDLKSRSIPVNNLDIAWHIWEASSKGLTAAKIYALLQGLDMPTRLFPLLPEASVPELDIIRTPDHLQKLNKSLYASSDPGAGLRARTIDFIQNS